MPSIPEIQPRWLYPNQRIDDDLKAVYFCGEINVGVSPNYSTILQPGRRPNTVSIIGESLGDCGKGRIVDNEISRLLKQIGVSIVHVVRFQGGSNSGHSVEKGNIHLALHQIPSGVLYEQAIGIMDQGMIIHPEDLRSEIEYVETKVGDLRGKLVVSEQAILATDLERAEENLNRIKSGKAKGGTGRGIGPAYAHHYDRLGLKVNDLIRDDWEVILREKYNRYKQEFSIYGLDLSKETVPDLKRIKAEGKAITRTVGTEEEFIDRLRETRKWLIERKLVTNTFLIHRDSIDNPAIAVAFEGAQAIGLHPWLGTLPDVTSSDTSTYGILAGTAIWTPEMVDRRIGVLKVPYTSSVGARVMPTQAEGEWSDWITRIAKEYGVTSGRRRQILYLDLAFQGYNTHVSGSELLAVTHLDICRETDEILVCTHCTRNGEFVPYQPGLRYQEGVTPNYISIPGWNGEQVRNARSAEDLPENALKFLALMQRRLGKPIIAATTGPDRANFLTFNGYDR